MWNQSWANPGPVKTSTGSSNSQSSCAVRVMPRATMQAASWLMPYRTASNHVKEALIDPAHNFIKRQRIRTLPPCSDHCLGPLEFLDVDKVVKITPAHDIWTKRQVLEHVLHGHGSEFRKGKEKTTPCSVTCPAAGTLTGSAVALTFPLATMALLSGQWISAPCTDCRIVNGRPRHWRKGLATYPARRAWPWW